MASHSKSLLCLLRRCVAVRQVTIFSGKGTRQGSPLTQTFIQQRSWTSTPRTVCLQRLCELQSPVKTSQYSLCTKTGSSCEDEYPPLPAYQPDPEPDKKEVYIVQVKGLPWATSTQELLQFFSECRIRDGMNGIHLTQDRHGRATGIAFVELEHEEDVSKALEKHRQYLGPRYVEVYEVTNRDAEALLKTVIKTQSDDKVVRLRGLPFSSNEEDIAAFFSGLDIAEKGITIVPDHRGRNSGEAYVQFTSQEAADEALQRDRQLIGNRYIEVYPSRREEIRSGEKKRTSPFFSQHNHPTSNNRTVSAPKNSFQTEVAAPPGPSQSTNAVTHCVHVRGLPFHASGEDIVNFFSPFVVSKIMIECGPDGRPNGEGDIYFSCHEDAIAAMSKDKQNMGSRYIELFLNSAPQ